MWNAYLKWFKVKRRKPYRNIALIGNPMEVKGFAEPAGQKTPPFQKAHFGKYERRNKRKSKLKYLLIIPIVIIIAYIIIESIPVLDLFSS